MRVRYTDVFEPPWEGKPIATVVFDRNRWRKTGIYTVTICRGKTGIFTIHSMLVENAHLIYTIQISADKQ